MQGFEPLLLENSHEILSKQNTGPIIFTSARTTFFFLDFILCECLFTWIYIMCTMYMPSTCGGQKMESKPFKLGLQVIVNHHVGTRNVRSSLLNYLSHPTTSVFCYCHSNLHCVP